MAISSIGRPTMFPSFRDPVAPATVVDSQANLSKGSSVATELSSFRAPTELSSNSVLPSDTTSLTKSVDPSDDVEKLQQLLNRDVPNANANANANQSLSISEEVQQAESFNQAREAQQENLRKQIDQVLDQYNERLNNDYIEFSDNSSIDNMVLTIKTFINGKEFLQTLPPEIKEDRIESLNKLVKDPQDPNVNEIA
jgi:uncharacterized FlaG/YvyC family protein